MTLLVNIELQTSWAADWMSAQVSIFFSCAPCRRDKHSADAFPSFLPGPPVDAANNPHTRFHLSLLGRMSTFRAASTRDSVFFSRFARWHGEQFKLTFPSFFPGPLDQVAINPTTRFQTFSFLPCHRSEQRERAFQSFFYAFPFFFLGNALKK